MKRKHKGGITVFTVLALSLVTGCLLALLEGTRIHSLRDVASLRTELAVEAPFGKYSSCLWENYRLLGSYVEQLQMLVEDSAESGYSENAIGTNLLMLKLEDVEVEEYTLLTDGEGVAYINAVSAYMNKNLMYETAKTIYNQYEAIKEIVQNNSSNGTEIEDALESIEEAKKTSKGGTEQNPLESIQKLQQTQLLELVVENTNELSTKEYELSETVSHRKLESGKEPRLEEVDWLDRVLLQQYLLTYLSDYTHVSQAGGLAYEVEYLIGGKSTDIANLREVVNQLLLIREAANLAYIFSDIEKCEVAQALALAMAGATANAAVIEVVKIGILVAWAFGESVLDVRALLQSKKIPLIKSQDTWTLSIENLGHLSTNYMVAKECEYGVSYKTYLGVLLLFQNEKQLAKRAMDVQEICLNQYGGGVLMDQLVVRTKVKTIYQYAPVFYSFYSKSQKNRNYEIVVVKEYGYY